MCIDKLKITFIIILCAATKIECVSLMKQTLNR